MTQLKIMGKQKGKGKGNKATPKSGKNCKRKAESPFLVERPLPGSSSAEETEPGNCKQRKTRSNDLVQNQIQDYATPDKRVVIQNEHNLLDNNNNATVRIQNRRGQPTVMKTPNNVCKIPREERVVTPVDARIMETIDQVDYEGDNVIVDIDPEEDNFGESSLNNLDEFLETETGQSSVTEVTFKPRGDDCLMLREDDPRLQRMIDNLVEKKVQAALKGQSGMVNLSENRQYQTKQVTPKPIRVQNKVKSPSDTTIYAPALAKNLNMTRPSVLDSMHHDASRDGQKTLTVQHINQIADFVEAVRLEQQEQQQQQLQRPQIMGRIVPSPKDISEAGGSGVGQVNDQVVNLQEQDKADVEEAKTLADQLIIQAEQFKAAVAPKSGINDVIQGKANDICDGSVSDFLSHPIFKGLINHIRGSLQVADPDDDFFHITCHLDANLKAKISRGEFVELERLLPKNKNQIINGDKKLQFYYQNGESYFAPSEGNNQITNVRRWEQAFRVYAAVYSEANPDRSSEIWQYVYVINKAASCFVWDNVYFYDVTFRHLMEDNPSRSWARTYTQMWNLAMCERIHKPFGGGNYNSFSNFSAGGKKSQGAGLVPQQTNKTKYCWKFNKNRQHDNASCEFVHRCSFCDNPNHIRNNCPKRNRNNGTGPGAGGGAGDAGGAGIQH